MILDDVFRIAEESHANVTVEFRSGSDETKPNRGYYVVVDNGPAVGPLLRADEATWAAVRLVTGKQ